MQTTTTRDLFPGPLEPPGFLEATAKDTAPTQTRSRSKKWLVGSALAASSLLVVVPRASGSLESPASLVRAEATPTVPQLAAWKRWLEGLGEEQLDPAVLAALREASRQLIEPTGLLPGGMATPAGAYLLTWDFDEHHLELELFSDHWEWFYTNRKTGRLAGEEDLMGTDFSLLRRQLAKYSA